MAWVGLLLLSSLDAFAAASCPAERAEALAPKDPALCARLIDTVRKPRSLPLDQYEARLGEFLRNFCYRDPAAGWRADKRLRDTGPYVGSLKDGKWSGTYYGPHPPVIVWYSADMFDWLKANRPEEGTPAPASAAAVPDGAVMVKEMFPAPAAACADVDPARLLPTSGAAVMVRDNGASRDGWFWGWFGWSDWAVDWPAPQNSPYPNMGFGQYCTNCHSSAQDNQTFASLRNIRGEKGEPLVYLSQNFFLSTATPSHHEEVTQAEDAKPAKTADPPFNPAFIARFWPWTVALPAAAEFGGMPAETYDTVWASAGEPSAANHFKTSDQCLGCHSAGGTGLQFDMTEPAPNGKLVNLSPYATWRSSPMGLSGRDPIFYAQLASETESFHPESAALLENTCLGCHGIQGQRQSGIDEKGAGRSCGAFSRRHVDEIPGGKDDPVERLARYAALARDGVSCMSCHTMALGKAAREGAQGQPENACVEERQALLGPDLSGFARTFTGSFMVGPPGKVYGPFEDPKEAPMKNALGLVPEHNRHVRDSELCGSCHVVRLPVLHQGKTIGHAYEQATYAEWAFSDYRTGTTPDGPLPAGAGNRAQSCQGCHMPSKNAQGQPFRSKIASIQEYSNFPRAEYTLGPAEIDLKQREGFAKHTLVGLNVFLIKIARQFPQLLGVRTIDPMLAAKGVDPLATTEQAMLDQAALHTADVHITAPMAEADVLTATVTVGNKSGHKFPSGVSFRRAFLQFEVLDRDGNVLWISGRTDETGTIIDETGAPIAGELWWSKDCTKRLAPARAHQPHYSVVTRQDQAQIYEELVADPGEGAAPLCGAHVEPAGKLTTSFLSVCSKVKDNRILPHGFLDHESRVEISGALGAGPDLAEEVAPAGTGADPDYAQGGTDSVRYRIPLAELPTKPSAVRATLFYQSTPPYFLQDRFCTSTSKDTRRLFFVAGKLKLDGTPAQSWKLKLTSAVAAVP